MKSYKEPDGKQGKHLWANQQLLRAKLDNPYIALLSQRVSVSIIVHSHINCILSIRLYLAFFFYDTLFKCSYFLKKSSAFYNFRSIALLSKNIMYFSQLILPHLCVVEFLNPFNDKKER